MGQGSLKKKIEPFMGTDLAEETSSQQTQAISYGKGRSNNKYPKQSAKKYYSGMLTALLFVITKD